jgi:hypothetical protein
MKIIHHRNFQYFDLSLIYIPHLIFYFEVYIGNLRACLIEIYYKEFNFHSNFMVESSILFLFMKILNKIIHFDLPYKLLGI